MAADKKTWALIHAQRAALADTLESLTPAQWGRASLCEGWTVKDLAGHVLSAAEQSPGRFLKGMASTGFRFNALMKRDADRYRALTTEQIVERLRQRTTTTNRPPAPVAAMLGEVVVHGADIRRPLGLPDPPAGDAAVACLDMYKAASFPVGGRKRMRGLRLVATDAGWSHGEGPEVSGPAISLVLAMTGRAAGLDGLSGDGLPVLRERLSGS